MKKLLLFYGILLFIEIPFFGQLQNNNDGVKYVIFTSDRMAEERKEGIYKYTSKSKSEVSLSFPIMFRYVSKTRGIIGVATYVNSDLDKLSKYRIVTESDKLVVKEDMLNFLDSINLIDMDKLFPILTKDEFIKIWNSLWNKKVYFIDRADIKDNKILLYPVHVFGINLY
jgi:hypothetical protein